MYSEVNITQFNYFYLRPFVLICIHHCNVSSLSSSLRCPACRRLLLTPDPHRPSRGALRFPLRSESEAWLAKEAAGVCCEGLVTVRTLHVSYRLSHSHLGWIRVSADLCVSVVVMMWQGGLSQFDKPHSFQ